MIMCNCKLCGDNRQIRARINGMLPEYQSFVEALWERAQEAEMDNDYHNAILSGDWPGSVEILEHALEKAKAKRNEC